MVEQLQFDLVIIGGGMVGASLACSLLPAVRQHGLKVAIVESHALRAANGELQYQPSYDSRSTALSYGSRNIFKQLGLWDQLSSHVTPIERIHVSDQGRFGSTRLNAAEYDIEALGYVVENAWLGQVLLEHIEQSEAISYFCPASVTELKLKDSRARIVIEEAGGEKLIEAELAVIADGGRSDVCRQLHIDMERHDYHQHAIIANVTAQKPHQNVAYERFTAQGPVALLPLFEDQVQTQNRLALVYTVDEADVETLMALDDASFLDQLQQRFGYRLGRFERIGQRANYPLALQWAKQQVRPGLVVMGNAAHTLHPVAGQGFNLALRGVAELTGVLHQGKAEGEALGSIDLLQSYLEQRLADQKKTIQFSDQTMRLFSNDDLLLRNLRDIGLVALDLLAPARKLFAQQAMGFNKSSLPSAMMGQRATETSTAAGTEVSSGKA